MRLSVLALAAIALVAFARPAFAQDSPPATDRLQLVLIDVASYTAFIAGAGSGAAPVAYLGLGGYLLGAPIVHAAHGHAGWAAASFGMRLTFPIVGGFIGGAAAGPCRSGDCEFHGLGEILGGMLIGAVTASVVDAVFFATPLDPPASESRFGVGVMRNGVALTGRF